ncbi:hypothetical protein OHC33_008539 [Knufia fluminis]|uniref:Uncharacterized protein n=1 Tax=Knufia fluminis TaxID=191047 RepID=A0AAN8EBR8_9EURO|nr:hypothetical protein OHC33_008539 [Knufia fluminis]
MVTASGFTHTPATRAFLALVVSSSVIVSILSLKPYLPLKIAPHLWPYLQFWRIATCQLAYSSSTELLFSTAILYQMRVLERVWGTRKFASFALAGYGLCMIGIVSVAMVLKIVSVGWWGYIPSGPSALVIAIVAVWRREIPRLAGFKILLDDDEQRLHAGTARGLELSDKWTVYMLATQLALSQFPFGLLPAVVGWFVGNAWTEELVPGGLVRWRIPAWVLGEDAQRKTGRGHYEGLRRRLQEEDHDGMREVTTAGVATTTRSQEGRRGVLGGVGRYFTSGS